MAFYILLVLFTLKLLETVAETEVHIMESVLGGPAIPSSWKLLIDNRP